MFKRFISDESGAVTVDWTVMTAGIVGLGIATYGVVSGGVESLATNTDTHLRSDWISTSFPAQVFAAMDFTGGDAGGWVGGTVMAPIAALGEMLVLGPYETASVTLDVPPGAKTATLSFDLIGGDTLDNEAVTISTNGRTVTTGIGSRLGRMNFFNSKVEGVTVTTEVISQGTDLGGFTANRDSVSRVTITVDDPGETLNLGMASGANQAINDEYFAVDNVSVTAE